MIFDSCAARRGVLKDVSSSSGYRKLSTVRGTYQSICSGMYSMMTLAVTGSLPKGMLDQRSLCRFDQGRWFLDYFTNVGRHGLMDPQRP